MGTVKHICQNTVKEWSHVIILSPFEKTLRKWHEFCDVSFFKTQNDTYNVLSCSSQRKEVGMSLLQLLENHVCHLWLVLVIEYVTHVSILNPQRINCFMFWIELVVVDCSGKWKQQSSLSFLVFCGSHIFSLLGQKKCVYE